MLRALSTIAFISLPLLFAGCLNTTHRVETVSEVKPIHITVDVNLKVDRQLNDFFGDIDEQSTVLDQTPSEPDHSN